MTITSAVMALAGGALIGAAAVLMMAANGRIMGVAGILGGLMAEPMGKKTAWRLAFVAGTIAPAMVLGLLGDLQVRGSDVSSAMLVVAGLLVGFGSRMGNGCTSGHGICGLARLSMRSLVAVLTFMAVAGATVYIRRHVAGG